MEQKCRTLNSLSRLIVLGFASLFVEFAKADADISFIKPEIYFPLLESKKDLKLPASIINKRLKNSPERKYIDPLFIYLKNDPLEFNRGALSLARKGQEASLVKALKAAYDYSKRVGVKKIKITPEIWRLIDEGAYGAQNKNLHHNLWLQTKTMEKEKDVLLTQLAPFFSEEDLRLIQGKIEQNSLVSVDKDLLPNYAKKRVGRFTVYRGPNCFQAALAFQNASLSGSRLVNVSHESDYHPTMINYDELWRVIPSHFYEINPQMHPVKYGDVILYLDVPTEINLLSNPPIDFRWIQHTSVFLFNNYVFSKGSKSADTPYSIKTLQEEWALWKKYTRQLKLKVFRFNRDKSQKLPIKDLKDWLY